jgi:hypothetical protein
LLALVFHQRRAGEQIAFCIDVVTWPLNVVLPQMLIVSLLCRSPLIASPGANEMRSHTLLERFPDHQ